jgi:acyl phosphate:glycerol-3-phosphate acyltransferase
MDGLGFVPVTLIPMVWIFAAYLIGSISFGIIISKVYGLPDPRTVGSGNIGATNVARSGKKSAAALTLFGDAFKGWLPVWMALKSIDIMWVVALVGLAVFLGHLYPIFHKFKGGKGVATALGVMLGISGWLGFGALAVWVVTFSATRISSISALVASATAPVIAWFLLSPYPDYLWLVLAMSVLLIWRHKTNIQKLLDGTEAGFKK